MRKVFENWEPLKNPRHGTSVMKEWKAILEGMGQPLLYNQDYIDPYDRLVWEVWMPEIRKAIRYVGILLICYISSFLLR